MEIKGDQIWHSPSPAELLAAAGQEITLKACVHNIRELGGIAFVVLRTGRYLIQSVYDKEVCPDNNLSQLSAGDCVRATGLLRAEPRAENGVELLLHGFTVLSRPASPLPLNLADKELKATLGTKGVPHRARVIPGNARYAASSRLSPAASGSSAFPGFY